MIQVTSPTSTRMYVVTYAQEQGKNKNISDTKKWTRNAMQRNAQPGKMKQRMN